MTEQKKRWLMFWLVPGNIIISIAISIISIDLIQSTISENIKDLDEVFPFVHDGEEDLFIYSIIYLIIYFYFLLKYIKHTKKYKLPDKAAFSITFKILFVLYYIFKTLCLLLITGFVIDGTQIHI